MFMDLLQRMKKMPFLADIKRVINGAGEKMLVGGDFNLIRSELEKFSDNINRRSMDMFNQFIADSELRELCRIGSTYTWSNNQLNPVRVVMDKEWEKAFPLVSLQALVRVGSDHNPLLVKTAEVEHIRNKIFRFEPA
ncbi:hypothetical protein BS78_K181400 [Paspalum vaginatum]|uniref:Endonuclease/exonuclease/phosphatase domain-containing protein n=1 Tax=Paspalum vaginatum TaxID=158149 RepID=A0A9W7XAZ1_9POAL|nr:hypothetical protein BS78_K181400 [Paspalum vaginatum]